MEKYSKASEKASKEARLWSNAAWTLPFIALAAIVFEHYIGWEDYIDKTIVIITVSFFGISVFWWWWALNKFVVLLTAFSSIDDSFKEIKDELKSTKEAIKNVGDR